MPSVTLGRCVDTAGTFTSNLYLEQIPKPEMILFNLRAKSPWREFQYLKSAMLPPKVRGGQYSVKRNVHVRQLLLRQGHEISQYTP